MGITKTSTTMIERKTARIYALIDPRNCSAFYVGVTSMRVCNRCSAHVTNAIKHGMTNGRSQRIRGIADAGLRVEYSELEAVNFDDWIEAEQFWIAYLRYVGCDLTNVAIGGPGNTGGKTDSATKEKQRQAAIGRDMSCVRAPDIRDKAADKLRHTIIVNGKHIHGIATAARLLGIPHSTLHHQIDAGKYERLTRRSVPSKFTLKGRRTGASHHSSVQVAVDGQVFDSMAAAMNATGMSREAIRKIVRAA